ncbi:MAG: YbaB/EbfC family nucleoid-associated protein, partial [Mycoplasma sp.]|nr:YbaB/EbfC family nucleoid-associated protein [Mycoplasma sp.]
QAKNMQKKLDEFNKREFEYDYSNGSVIVKLTGDLRIISLTINKTLIDPEDPITLQEMVAEAINSAMALVNEQKEEVVPSGAGMF